MVFGTGAGDSIAATAQVSFGAGADMATFTGSIGASSIYGGGGADTLDFNAVVGAATIDVGAGADSLDFNNVALAATTVYGGAAADIFSGGISVGAGGVSFWGGAGGDSFDFSTGISNATNTAYFWNDQTGTDTINIAAANTVSGNFGFGVTAGSGLVISYGAAGSFGAGGTATDVFSAQTSSLFSIGGNHGSSLVTMGGSTTLLTLQWAGGSTVSFFGAAGISADFYQQTGFLAGAGTANFGVGESFPTFS